MSDDKLSRPFCAILSVLEDEVASSDDILTGPACSLIGMTMQRKRKCQDWEEEDESFLRTLQPLAEREDCSAASSETLSDPGGVPSCLARTCADALRQAARTVEHRGVLQNLGKLSCPDHPGYSKCD